MTDPITKSLLLDESPLGNMEMAKPARAHQPLSEIESRYLRREEIRHRAEIASPLALGLGVVVATPIFSLFGPLAGVLVGIGTAVLSAIVIEIGLWRANA